MEKGKRAALTSADIKISGSAFKTEGESSIKEKYKITTELGRGTTGR